MSKVGYRLGGKSPYLHISDDEWMARQELAAAYRLFDEFGWHEIIYNHITVRVPGEPNHFLINPFGLLYREVCASNIVKIDHDGNIVGPTAHTVNPAGFVVHSAVHVGRPEVNAVAHTHTTAGQAVSCQSEGLLDMSFTSMFFSGRVAYHDFEGIVLDIDERERLASSLQDNDVLILRNHGLLSCGKNLADAFANLYHLQRACEVQIAAQAGGVSLLIPSKSVAERVAGQYKKSMDTGVENRLMFDALTRWMIEKDSSFLL